MTTRMPLRGVKRFFEPKTGKTYAYHRAGGRRSRRSGRPPPSPSNSTRRSEGGFHASWRRVRRRLEKEGKVKPGLTPHGLRHSVATDLLRELGKTERKIADILGQRTTYAVPTYARSADMRRSNKRVIADLYGEKEDPGGEGGTPDR